MVQKLEAPVKYMKHCGDKGWQKHANPHCVVLSQSSNEAALLSVFDSSTNRTRESVCFPRDVIKSSVVDSLTVRFSLRGTPVRKFALCFSAEADLGTFARRIHIVHNVRGVEELAGSSLSTTAAAAAMTHALPDLSAPTVQAYVARLLFDERFHDFVCQLGEFFSGVSSRLPVPLASTASLPEVSQVSDMDTTPVTCNIGSADNISTAQFSNITNESNEKANDKNDLLKNLSCQTPANSSSVPYQTSGQTVVHQYKTISESNLNQTFVQTNDSSSPYCNSYDMNSITVTPSADNPSHVRRLYSNQAIEIKTSHQIQSQTEVQYDNCESSLYQNQRQCETVVPNQNTTANHINSLTSMHFDHDASKDSQHLLNNRPSAQLQVLQNGQERGQFTPSNRLCGTTISLASNTQCQSKVLRNKDSSTLHQNSNGPATLAKRRGRPKKKSKIDNQSIIPLNAAKSSATNVSPVQNELNQDLSTKENPQIPTYKKYSVILPNPLSTSRGQQKRLYQELRQIWDRIHDHEDSWPFHDPVHPKTPGYRELISHPVDLSSIRRRIEGTRSEPYNSCDELRKDIHLMLSNCRIFNEPDSDYILAANALEADLDKIFYPPVDIFP